MIVTRLTGRFHRRSAGEGAFGLDLSTSRCPGWLQICAAETPLHGAALSLKSATWRGLDGDGTGAEVSSFSDP